MMLSDLSLDSLIDVLVEKYDTEGSIDGSTGLLRLVRRSRERRHRTSLGSLGARPCLRRRSKTSSHPGSSKGHGTPQTPCPRPSSTAPASSASTSSSTPRAGSSKTSSRTATWPPQCSSPSDTDGSEISRKRQSATGEGRSP